jgi:hypothetical protein
MAKLLEVQGETSQELAENREVGRVLHEIVDGIEGLLDAVEAPAFETELRHQVLGERLVGEEGRGAEGSAASAVSTARPCVSR